VEDFIENKRVLLRQREAALKRNIKNLIYVNEEVANRFKRDQENQRYEEETEDEVKAPTPVVESNKA
jgi:hypothetical protein